MATIPASENEYPEVLFAEGAAPAAPATGLVKAYAKADGLLYSKDDAGAETALGAGTHIADTTDAHDASAVSVLDTATNFTGTDVEAVLAELQDNIDAVSAGGFPSGTSNPGSPSSGDQFFRTDLGLVIYYDGTRWVTTTLFTVDLFMQPDSSLLLMTGAGINGTATISRRGVPSAANDLWLVDWIQLTRVLSTNDGTHNWTMTLRKFTTAVSGTDVATYTTAAHTAGNMVTTVTPIGALVGTTNIVLQVGTTKNSSPGNLVADGGTVRYRRVIT